MAQHRHEEGMLGGHVLRQLVGAFDNISEAVCILDSRGRVAYLNKAAEEIFRHEPSDLLGKSIGESLPSIMADTIKERCHQAVTRNSTIQFEIPCAHLHVWLEGCAQPSPDGVTLLFRHSGHRKPLSADVELRSRSLIDLSLDRDPGGDQEAADRMRAERERETAIELLSLITSSGTVRELLKKAVTFFQERSGCEAVGIRLREGEDYPYYEYNGFTQEFILAENKLCALDSSGNPLRDSCGNLVLECVCGAVICGRVDSSRSFFTEHGSFWTSSVSELYANTDEAEIICSISTPEVRGRIRGRCVGHGYQSMAFIPLRLGKECLGLLQLNDRQPGRFTLEQIAIWEHLAKQLAIALAQLQAREALRESEERFRSLVEMSPDGVFVHCNGRVVFANTAVLRLLGATTPEQVLGRPALDLVHPDYRPLTEALLRQLASGVSVGLHEKKFLRLDGSPVDVEVAAAPLAYGGKPAVQVIVRDITARKRAEESLRQSEMRLNHAQALAHLGSYEFAWPEGEVTWSEETFRIVGRDSRRGAPNIAEYMEIVHPDDRVFTAQQVQQAVDEKRPFDFEYRIVREDGSVRHLHSIGRPVLNGAGDVVRVFGTILDITEEKAKEQALAWEAAVNASMAELAQAVGASTSINEISSLVLGHAKRLTGSTLGYVGYIDPDSGYLTVPTLTEEVWDVCQVAGKDVVYKEFTGLWGWVLTNRKPVVTNNPSQDTRSRGTPPGHMPIRRFLSAPAILGQDLVGAIGLANADRDYTDADLQLVERLASLYAIAVQRKRAEERLRQEKELLQTIFDHIPAMITLFDAEGRPLLRNREWERILGWPLEEAQGQNMLAKCYPDPEERARVQDFIAAANGQWADFRMRARDGRIIDTAWANVFLSDGRSIGIGRDITQHKQAEETLRRYRLLAESSRDIILFIRFRDGQIIEANKAAVTAYGYSREELLALTIHELRSPEATPLTSLQLEEAGASGIQFEAMHVRKSGASFPVEVSSRSAMIGHEKVFLSVIRDITERRQAEETTRKQQADLAHLSRVASVGEMASSLAHELNQPLAALVNYAGVCRELLRRSPHISEMFTEAVDRIGKETKRAADIVHGLRGFIRKRDPQRQAMDINAVARSAVDLLSGECRRVSLRPRLKLAADLPPAMIDPVQIQQVLVNLLQNAIDAMSETPLANRSLIVRTSLASNKMIQVSVADTGCGLDPRIRDRIFESFTTTKPNGLGLGLAISRSIVEGHGGRLTVTANLPCGATFEFTLPGV